MNAQSAGRIITAIDIGTTKICVLVCTVNGQGKLEVLGVGQHPSYGLKKGVVVSIAMTVQSIQLAVKDAELSSGIPIKSAIVGISGSHIQSFNSAGVVPIKHRDVGQDDIDQVIKAARAVPISEDREILHVIPQYFKVDGGDCVEDSFGMHGVRLEAQVHIVTTSVSSAQNIIKACELAGVMVSDIILEQLASAEAVLSASERELGVGILDIGGGTADLAIYRGGKIMHSKVIPVAGSHFTNDLAIGLGLPVHVAEKLKRQAGFVAESAFPHDEGPTLKISSPEDHVECEIETMKLYEILQPRAAEMFEFVMDEMVENRLRQILGAGLVLTGGGALLRGMKDCGTRELGLPVRIGKPHHFKDSPVQAEVPDSIKSPVYSTAYGIVLYAMRGGDNPLSVGRDGSMFNAVFKKMKSWLYDFL